MKKSFFKIGLTVIYATAIAAMTACNGSGDHHDNGDHHHENDEHMHDEAQHDEHHEDHDHHHMDEGHMHGDSTHMNEEHMHDSHTHEVMYHCPMACEGDKTYHKSGKCPVCGMDLEKVEEEEK